MTKTAKLTDNAAKELERKKPEGMSDKAYISELILNQTPFVTESDVESLIETKIMEMNRR